MTTIAKIDPELELNSIEFFDSTDSSVSNLAIKRSDSCSSLDGLFGYTASDVEEKKELEVIPSDFSEVFGLYTSCLDLSFRQVYDQNIGLVLSPTEINLFLQLTDIYKDHGSYPINTGPFVTRLIQSSYNANNNGFYLDITSLGPLNYIAFRLKGDKNNPINLTIDGNATPGTLANLENVNAKIIGTTHYTFGKHSKNLTLDVIGRLKKGYHFYETTGSILKVQNKFESKKVINLFESLGGEFYQLDFPKKGNISIPNRPIIDLTKKPMAEFNKLIYKEGGREHLAAYFISK